MNTVSNQDMGDLLTSVSLKKKQSVRATFRLPDEIINLLSIVVSPLGLKQKLLIDQLIADKELLDRLVEICKENNRALKSIVDKGNTMEDFDFPG